jgi:hypothetical protein
VIFLPPEESQQTRIMAAIGALAPPQSPGGPGPFALSEPGAVESALQAAGLRPIDAGEVPIVLSYPEAETACRAFLAGGGSARAIQHSGEERVRRAMRDVFCFGVTPLPRSALRHALGRVCAIASHAQGHTQSGSKSCGMILPPLSKTDTAT